MIQCALYDWVSLQVVFPGEYCVWLVSCNLMKALGMFLVVLLKDQGSASQYKLWDIPGGSTATLLPCCQMICCTHYSVYRKQMIIIIIIILGIWL